MTSESPEPEIKKSSTLIVDDHPIYRLGLRALLRGEPGFGILAEADSGEGALEMVDDLQPDLAIVDVTLPGISGFEVVDQIRRRSPGTAIVFVSIHKDPELIREAYRVGAAAYVAKDDPPARLLAAIREGLSQARSNGDCSPLVRSTPDARISSAVSRLTPRERQVMAMIADGLSNKDIARSLTLSVRTVEVHRKNILQKIEVRSTAELIRRALQFGLTDY